ncbi:Right handed beta helix region, partial [Methanobrevibacter olleyae]
MELFSKRNFVFLMAIFLLFITVASVSAIDTNETSVNEENLAVDTLSSSEDVSIYSQEIEADPVDDSISYSSNTKEKLSQNNTVGDDSISYSSGAKEELSSDNTGDNLRADVNFDLTVYVGSGSGEFSSLQAAINSLSSSNRNYQIIIREGTYTGNGNRNVDVSRNSWINPNFKYLLIRADDGANVTFDGQGNYDLLHINSENVHIQNLNFINANNPSLYRTGGVCLDINKGHFSADNCYFANNGDSILDHLWGGAIHVNNNLQDINITNSFFENNTAQVGGVIRAENGANNINIINCTFKNNYASTHGGVACLFGNNILFENCLFENNSAPSSGGVHFHTGNSTVKNCTFIENKATGSGNDGYAGALGLVYTNANGVTVVDSKFYNNTATGDGGAIQIIGGGSNAKIFNSVFENNSASYGGAVSIKGSLTKIDNSTFINNIATGSSGGAIFIQGSNTTINNSTILNNSANQNGGGILTNGTGTIINNTIIGYNEASANGGGLHISGGSNFIVSNSTVYNNTAQSGAGIYINGSNANVINSNITNNTATGNGSGVYISGNNAVISNSNITNNNATVNGGGAYITGTNANIQNTHFDKNNAIPDEDKLDDGLGGALYIAGSNGHVTDCNFTYNTARNGSAIYVNPTNANVYNYVDGCIFVDNQAWSYWLPIYYNNVTHTIETNLTGGNNILNAIYNNGRNDRLRINGQYPVLGWENSNNGTIMYQDVREFNQTIVTVVYDRQGNLVFNETAITGLAGNVTYNIPENTSNWFIVNMTHLEDTYYKYISNITGININPGLTISDVIMYEGNTTPQIIYIYLADDESNPLPNEGPINVYVYVNGGKVLLGSGNTSSFAILTFYEGTLFQTLASGNYTTEAEYSYLYFNTTTHQIENKTIFVNGNLEVLPLIWNVTKTIIAVNDVPYVEGMTICLNDNITFNITVYNNIEGNITSLKITDLDTAGLQYLETIGTEWNYNGNHSWSLSNLTGFGNSSLIVKFTATQLGTCTNVADVSIFNGFSNKSANVSFICNKYPSSVNASDVTVVYGEPIVVPFSSENATNVTYVVLDENGNVVASGAVGPNGTIAGLDLGVGNYTVNLTTVVDGNHSVAVNVSSIIVTPAGSSVNASDVTVVYGEPIVVPFSSEN